MAGPLQTTPENSDLTLVRTRAGQFVKPQSQFETVSHQHGNSHQERVRATLARRSAQAEARRQKESAARQRQAAQLQTMIRDLQREVGNLDDSIASELAMSGAHEPSRFARPVSVAMMQTRRENLKNTIAALTDRFSAVAQAVAEPSGSTNADAVFDPHTPTRFAISQE